MAGVGRLAESTQQRPDQPTRTGCAAQVTARCATHRANISWSGEFAGGSARGQSLDFPSFSTAFVVISAYSAVTWA